MKRLGPLGSYQEDVSPTNVFYVDLTDCLADDEYISSAYVTADEDMESSDSLIEISEVGPNLDSYTDTETGATIAAKKGVKFRVTTGGETNESIAFNVSYETDASNADALKVWLEVKTQIE